MLEPFRHVLVACVIPGVPCLGLDLCLGRLGGGVALVVAIGPRALLGGFWWRRSFWGVWVFLVRARWDSLLLLRLVVVVSSSLSLVVIIILVIIT